MFIERVPGKRKSNEYILTRPKSRARATRLHIDRLYPSAPVSPTALRSQSPNRPIEKNFKVRQPISRQNSTYGCQSFTPKETLNTSSEESQIELLKLKNELSYQLSIKGQLKGRIEAYAFLEEMKNRFSRENKLLARYGQSRCILNRSQVL